MKIYNYSWHIYIRPASRRNFSVNLLNFLCYFQKGKIISTKQVYDLLQVYDLFTIVFYETLTLSVTLCHWHVVYPSQKPGNTVLNVLNIMVVPLPVWFKKKSIYLFCAA